MIQLVNLSNQGPEILKYSSVIHTVNDALNMVIEGKISAIDALEMIDFYLYHYDLSNYRDYSYANTKGKARRDFSSSDICYSCNFKILDGYMAQNCLDKSVFYDKTGWHEIKKKT